MKDFEPVVTFDQRIKPRRAVYLDICEYGATVVLEIRRQHVNIISSFVPAEEQLKRIREELVQTSLSGGVVIDIDSPPGDLQSHHLEFFADLIRGTRRGMPRRDRRHCFTRDVRIAFCCAQFRTIRVLNVMGLGQIKSTNMLPNRVPIHRTLDEAAQDVFRPQLRCISADDEDVP